MTFVLTALPKRLIIFGIAAYAADIVFVSNIASLLEGWYIEHLSWHWIFWTAAAITPVMMICIYFGIPRRPSAEPNRVGADSLTSASVSACFTARSIKASGWTG